MSEPIVLEDGKYSFQRTNYHIICKRHDEDWRDFIGDKAVWALFNYTLNLQAEFANMTCNCEYILPSKSANNPDVHNKNCHFRLIVERIKNE